MQMKRTSGFLEVPGGLFNLDAVRRAFLIVWILLSQRSRSCLPRDIEDDLLQCGLLIKSAVVPHLACRVGRSLGDERQAAVCFKHSGPIVCK